MNPLAVRIEAVCQSADDCRAAERAGASRVELVCAPEQGGLTPTLGVLRSCLGATALPVVASLRPRVGGFCYSAGDRAAMLDDIQSLSSEAVDSIIFGILTDSGELDEDACRTLVAAAGPVPCVLHRAFDAAPDRFAALEAAIRAGFRRILTSGGCPTALEGAGRIRELRDAAAGRIDILPGGGVRHSNAAELVRRTGADWLHMGPYRLVDEPGGYGPRWMLDEAEIAAAARAVADL